MKRMVAWLKHAFLVEKESDFQHDEQDLELIDTVCREIVKRGMATPAVLFLESATLNYVGSQTMAFSSRSTGFRGDSRRRIDELQSNHGQRFR